MTLPCLYSTLKNTSGVEKYFGFFGQGLTLAPDEEWTVPGDIVNRLALSKAFDRVFPSFEEALDNVELVILKSPAVHLYDAATAEVRVLSLAGGTLGTVAPCWGQYSDSVAEA